MCCFDWAKGLGVQDLGCMVYLDLGFRGEGPPKP